MSSLAGALIPPESSLSSQAQSGYDYTTSNHDHMQENSEDEQEEQPHDEEMNDLFGNEADGDVEEARENNTTRDNSEIISEEADAEAEQRRALEYGEDEEPADVAVEVKEADVSFPNLPVPTSSNGESWVIRMPNFVKVDSKPFHPDTYIGPEQEDEEAQPAETLREKSMIVKLNVENTVRWRWVKDQSGADKRESNSRIIRWSDGTLSLRLGKELFDITQSIDTAGGVPRNIGPTASQSQQTDNPLRKPQGLTYLVAQHKRSQVLQAEAVITGQMTLRPTGMQSETHRMLVRAVGQKHNKVARLRMAPDPQVDPEREKMELMKLDAKKSKRKSSVDSGFARKRRAPFRRAEPDYDDDDEDVFRQSDEDDDGKGSSAAKGKRKRDEEKSGYQEDDFLVADDSDDDAEYTSNRKRRDEEEEDPLDKLDAKIQRAEKGKRADSDEDAEGEDVGMDVESEEEEEHRVRKAGGAGSRRRQQPLYDDDDEDE
ncbi:Paf1 complex component [Paramarasmius palmivorus]|uniref:Paf1 complex component n=1 Tax=Paramarasmius palmivorus TaxID=297713 RepID=A0AAW0DZF5_9AGAR